MLDLIQVVGVPTSFKDIGEFFTEWVGTVLSTTAAGGTFRPPVFVQHSHVSAYIHGCILGCLPGSSADGSLTDQNQRLDSRDKGVMKDVLSAWMLWRKKSFPANERPPRWNVSFGRCHRVI